MSGEKRLQGLALKVGPLGEHDRLLTLLSDEAGVVRLAVPGARRPRSSLAAAVPLRPLGGVTPLPRREHVGEAGAGQVELVHERRHVDQVDPHPEDRTTAGPVRRPGRRHGPSTPAGRHEQAVATYTSSSPRRACGSSSTDASRPRTPSVPRRRPCGRS